MSETRRGTAWAKDGTTGSDRQAGPVEEPQPAAVFAAAANASPAYTAAAAKGAATALVRMFMEQGVFGFDIPFAEPTDTEAEASATSGTAASPPVVEPTAWERARSAVGLAERRRTANGTAAEPDVTSVRLMGDAIGAVRKSGATPQENRTTPTVRAA